MNIFENPKQYLDEIVRNIKLNNQKRLTGKSFICAFFTKKCKGGCEFCFFKSNYNNLEDIEESYEMSEEGFHKFINFVNDSNNGYLLLSGGGEPFEKSEYVIKTIQKAKTDRIVIATNGMWARDYQEAKKMIKKLSNALNKRDKKIPVTLRISMDKYHYKNLGDDIYKNIIDIFSKEYANDEFLKLKFHTIIGDNTIAKFAEKNKYIIDNNVLRNISDNNKIFKLMPEKFQMIIKEDYSIDISAAKLFYPIVTPNLNKEINEEAIKVFDTDIQISETNNPTRVQNIEGEDGIDFWVNYNGNITTWQNEQKNSIYNLYVDDYKAIEDASYNNILSYAVIDKGYYYREEIYNEINPKAVIRAKLSNMRDLSTALLTNESKSNLYYAIRVIQDYKDNIDLSNISKELLDYIQLSKKELITQYNKSDYSILDEYMDEDFNSIEWHDLFYTISLGEYDISPKAMKRGIDYYNQNNNSNYKSFEDVLNSIKNDNLLKRNDRIIERLTRMKKEARDYCLFSKALKDNNIEIMKQVPMADLHAHGTRSGTIQYFENKYNTTISQPKSYQSIEDMNNWYSNHIKVLLNDDKNSFIERLKAAFINANENNIKKLILSFGTGNLLKFDNNIDEYIDTIKQLQETYYKGIFIPELCLVRGNIDYKLYKKLINTGYFKSIDLVGDEKLGVDDYIEIYKYAKENNMILRCHVGEFTDSSFVSDAIDKLGLDEVQHGLSIINDKDLIHKIKEKNIRINLCPESNRKLNRVKEYSEPLRFLLDKGIRVSVNTDDVILFNKQIGEIYLDLYHTNLFTIEELNEIRVNSLNE